VLLAQVGVGAIAYQADLRSPYSASEPTARFIERRGLAEGPIAGCPEITLSAVAGHLRRPLHYLDVGAPGTYVNYGRPHPPCTDVAHVRRQLLAVAAPNGPPVVAIFNQPLAIDTAGLSVVELARFTESAKGDERYYVYLVTRDVEGCAHATDAAAARREHATALDARPADGATARAVECAEEPSAAQ
jgi:hypothetical protein